MIEVRKGELNNLLEELADSIAVPNSRYEQAEERYKAISGWLSRIGSAVANYDPKIYPQGSFRLGTAIRPISSEEEYDIDIVCELNLSKKHISQKRLKELVGVEIKEYAKANSIIAPIEESRRCWTLCYADGAQFHADILPSIPDRESFRLLIETRGYRDIPVDEAIAITDNTMSNYSIIDDDWLQSNPKGYSNWFKGRMQFQFDLKREALAKAAKTIIEEIPEYKVKTPLQKAAQILKRHRDIMFAEDQENKPISIIITTLAAHAYNNEAKLLDALIAIVNGMSQFLEVDGSGTTWVRNPANPTENFADKWIDYPGREKAFKEWLEQVRKDLRIFLISGDLTAWTRSSLTTIAISSVGRFDAPHRKTPKWPLNLKGTASITATAECRGFRPKIFYSDSTALPKHYSLRFVAQTDISWPFKVHWQVVNTGLEAREASCLRGGFYEGILEKGGRVRNESTLYKGMHWIECFIIKNGVCVARSGEFVVNIV